MIRECTNCGCVYLTSGEHLCAPSKTNPNDLVMGTLTKREFIAAMVMQGYSSRDHNKGRMICDYTYASKEAVERADELIEELNK